MRKVIEGFGALIIVPVSIVLMVIFRAWGEMSGSIYRKTAIPPGISAVIAALICLAALSFLYFSCRFISHAVAAGMEAYFGIRPSNSQIVSARGDDDAPIVDDNEPAAGTHSDGE